MLSRNDRPFYVIAHRGAARFAPENTTAAFAKATELGANAIEVDVSATKDKYLVMWHDENPLDPVSFVRRRAENFP